MNDTLGIGSYLSFTVSNVDLGGNDLQIEASNKYASGGAGLMLGGTAEQIKIEGIQSVTAGNYAAGFAGRAGTGSLAKEGGLDLLGLGLIKVDSLLSLVDGVATKVSNVSVSGTENGAVIKASGQVEITEGESILAGGFISEAEGVQIADSHVTNLKAVYAEAAKDNKEGYAGGFCGKKPHRRAGRSGPGRQRRSIETSRNCKCQRAVRFSSVFDTSIYKYYRYILLS